MEITMSDEVFKNKTFEDLAKDIYERICARLKRDFSEDFQSLHKLKITLTESNVAWASFEKEIDK